MTQIEPSQEIFCGSYRYGKPQLVWAKIVSDLETPVSAMLKLKDEHEPSFLLESVEGGEVRGRYSIIGLKPDLLWRCNGNQPEISREAPFNDASFVLDYQDSLASLRALAARCELELPRGLPPMSAGLIGYFGYDMVKVMERLPDTKPDAIGIPDACFMRPTLSLIFDAVDGVAYIIAPVWADREKESAEEAYRSACSRIETALRKLQGPIDQRNYHRPQNDKAALAFQSNLTVQEYETMVLAAKEYIRAGDIFQVVLSQRFAAPFAHSPFALYRSLRHMNPSPFLFYLNYGGFTLVGSSPEILVRARDGKVTIRPIAGTRKRGKTPEEDKALAEELLNDPKEMAEHLMLLDLGRNDVGRVAKGGSVTVTQRMTIEHYSHVMHIVSNVEGELDPKHDAIDALKAGFPAGTVSGAPKIRAMEIIDELEPVRRSFYAGAVGYISANGSLDTCITLRTGLVKDGTLYVQAGGGIVADSEPQGEYEESMNKAMAVMRAAEAAAQFA